MRLERIDRREERTQALQMNMRTMELMMELVKKGHMASDNKEFKDKEYHLDELNEDSTY